MMASFFTAEGKKANKEGIVRILCSTCTVEHLGCENPARNCTYGWTNPWFMIHRRSAECVADFSQLDAGKRGTFVRSRRPTGED